MLDFKEFEYETQLKNRFTPEIKIAVINPIYTENDNIQHDFAEKLQNSTEKTQKTEVFSQNNVSYEIRNVTPKSIFRRK